jgi:hypothetical protein
MVREIPVELGLLETPDEIRAARAVPVLAGKIPVVIIPVEPAGDPTPVAATRDSGRWRSVGHANASTSPSSGISSAGA